MKKQILFAHSAGSQDAPGKGSYDFVNWLTKQLGTGYEIAFPIIEDPEAPEYQMWEVMLKNEFSKLDEEVILIGHSLGGSTLLKYLSENDSNVKIGGLLLLATPYWGAPEWEIDEFLLRKDFSKFLPPITSVHLFHCTNDPFVPFEHLKFYKQDLHNAIVHELQGDSHAFADGLPELVEIIKNLNHF